MNYCLLFWELGCIYIEKLIVDKNSFVLEKYIFFYNCVINDIVDIMFYNLFLLKNI